ncbi:hypothetical protein CEXT_565381 [Caerostris extrusa]|uniref:Uncharacterized protein n=1 Tax=Caerostris extrusa TaxID=172846 RepID=A0AAV4VLV7_CAEEX|nr:hypothetical protein CEXT_565381 [Caerostris extrusa]
MGSAQEKSDASHFHLRLSLQIQEETPFLKQVVTGDEKWDTLALKVLGKGNEALLATPKARLYSKKVMLCVWWDWKGILHY